jgi:phage terminase large subunit-like protein
VSELKANRDRTRSLENEAWEKLQLISTQVREKKEVREAEKKVALLNYQKKIETIKHLRSQGTNVFSIEEVAAAIDNETATLLGMASTKAGLIQYNLNGKIFEREGTIYRKTGLSATLLHRSSRIERIIVEIEFSKLDEHLLRQLESGDIITYIGIATSEGKIKDALVISNDLK